MVENIKKIMGFNNNHFDSVIEMYIKSAKADLKQIGIVGYKVQESDPLIYSAIISYVLSLLDVPNAELYSNAYALQKDELRHFSDYITESGD